MAEHTRFIPLYSCAACFSLTAKRENVPRRNMGIDFLLELTVRVKAYFYGLTKCLRFL